MMQQLAYITHQPLLYSGSSQMPAQVLCECQCAVSLPWGLEGRPGTRLQGRGSCMVQPDGDIVKMCI